MRACHKWPTSVRAGSTVHAAVVCMHTSLLTAHTHACGPYASDSHANPPTHPPACPPTHPIAQTPTPLPSHAFTLSPTRKPLTPSESRAHPPVHPLIQPPTHSCAHHTCPPACPPTQWCSEGVGGAVHERFHGWHRSCTTGKHNGECVSRGCRHRACATSSRQGGVWAVATSGRSWRGRMSPLLRRGHS